ncbi:MAG: hypothetical protein H9W81_05820 [Enterococcus sp.]|nr:hypothetical protein [Enterococcus sp.]
MSRTFKDRPYWVRANDPQQDRYAYHNHIYVDECPIDEKYTSNFGSYSRACGYALPWTYYRNDTPKKVRNTSYWIPLRTDERKVLNNLTRDYNTYGEIDEDFFLQEHHRHARYGGGYWD